ncbi:MAG: hypothetical protein Q8Q73_06150 [Stagnimonas sp.]|nr:hypothetical protein [Stagnimonas sp.]
MRNTLIASALLLLAPLAQAESIPLREGLTLVTAVTRPTGNIETTLKVTAVTPRLVKLSFNGRNSDGSPLAAMRNLRVSDLKSARAIRPNFVGGGTEFFENATAFGTSAQVLGELKRGSSTLTVDVGGLSMGTGVAGGGLARELDGMLEGMGGFAGISEALKAAQASGAISDSEAAEGAGTMGDIGQLQMAQGKLTAAGKTTVAVTVNGKKVELPGIVAKGRISKGEEAYDSEWVFLDDAANPLTLKSRIGTESTQLLRIDYPAAAK